MAHGGPQPTHTIPARPAPCHDYPVALRIRANELRAAEWSLRKIQRFIERETGRRPSLQTIHRWVVPEQERKHYSRVNARRRREQLAGSGAGGRLGNHRHTREFRFARIVALRATGLSPSAIAMAMNFDYGTDMTAAQIANTIALGRPTRPYRARKPKTEVPA